MKESLRVDFERSRVALKKMLLDVMPEPGDYPTPVEGFTLHRYNSADPPKPRFYQPVVIVVVQGKKWVRIGEEEIAYGEQTCFVAGIDMPVASCVMEADESKPYVSMSLNLDKSLIATLAAKIPHPSGLNTPHSSGAAVQEIGPELLDAFLRLLELGEKPEQVPIMGSLLYQEIHFRLLTSPFGSQLRSLNTLGSQGNQIARAISWLKDNYKEPLRVKDLADQLNMASSTLHKHFKDITTLSPLQYQKQLRLNEAQRLMLSESHDVMQAAYAVGYESVTQFHREYRRLFGESPRRDVLRMKEAPKRGHSVIMA